MSSALEVSGKNDGLVFRKKTDPATWRSASPAELIRGGFTIKRPVIADDTLEALKWLALLLMTGDHVNKYLFNGTLPWLFNAGRVTLPLFVFVIAYNLARPDILERGVYPRTMKRLALFGALATPAFIALGGLLAGWWPLNIMFALLGLTAILYLIEQRTIGGYAAAVAVFLLVGSSVEFWWPALAFGVAVWWYCKQPDWKPLALAFATLAALWFVNSNLWALAAVPVLLLASRFDLRLPRPRWLFYAYYPLHLATLWLLRIPMSKAGYLFFLPDRNRTRLCHGNCQLKSATSPATSSPFTRTFFQEISMQITIRAHTSGWILIALCSGCASVAVTDNTLEQRTANATSMAVGSFTITDRVDEGMTKRYIAKGKNGQTFNCYVTGTVSFLGRQVSDAQCNPPGRNEGGAADNALLREYNKKAR